MSSYDNIFLKREGNTLSYKKCLLRNVERTVESEYYHFETIIIKLAIGKNHQNMLYIREYIS